MYKGLNQNQAKVPAEQDCWQITQNLSVLIRLFSCVFIFQATNYVVLYLRLGEII